MKKENLTECIIKADPLTQEVEELRAIILTMKEKLGSDFQQVIDDNLSELLARW